MHRIKGHTFLPVPNVLLAFEIRAERILAGLPEAEEELKDADKKDAVERSDLLDEHGGGFASGDDAEWQPVRASQGGIRRGIEDR